MKKLLVVLVFFVIIMGVIVNAIINPIQSTTGIGKESYPSDIIGKSLIYLRCPGQNFLSTANGIQITANRTGIDGVLIASLLYTESNFRFDAKSRKGYRGIGQTSSATVIYPEADILHSGLHLQHKLHLSNGNMFEALARYKGGHKKKMARKQAIMVLLIYNYMKKVGEMENVIDKREAEIG